VREDTDPYEVSTMIEADTKTRGRISARIVMAKNKAASRGVVSDLCYVVFRRADRFTRAAVTGASSSPALAKIETKLIQG
jgi:hypothetical protein